MRWANFARLRCWTVIFLQCTYQYVETWEQAACPELLSRIRDYSTDKTFNNGYLNNKAAQFNCIDSLLYKFSGLRTRSFVSVSGGGED